MILKHLTNIDCVAYCPPRLCDVFGVGSIVGSAIQGGLTLSSTLATNASNEAINKRNLEFAAQEAEKSRQFNADQAELSRQFNADQAEISRQWNSEQAVMDRRREAGLNTANPTGSSSGGGSSPSAASSPASSSPASVPSAIPMQSPDMSGVIDSMIALAKSPSDIANTKANTSKSLKEIDKLNSDIALVEENIIHQKIVNSREADLLDATISSLLSRAHLDSSQKVYYDALSDNVYNSTLDNILGMFFQFAGFDKDALELQEQYNQFVQVAENEASKLFNTIKFQSITSSFELGNVDEIFNKAIEDTFHRKSKGIGTHFGINTSNIMPVSLNSGIDFSASWDDGSSISLHSGRNYVERFKNHPLYDEYTKALATSKLLRDAKTPQQRKLALLECRHLIRMVNDFTKLRNEVDLHNRLKSNSPTIPTYIPTQLPAPANEVF